MRPFIVLLKVGVCAAHILSQLVQSVHCCIWCQPEGSLACLRRVLGDISDLYRQKSGLCMTRRIPVGCFTLSVL